MDKQVATTLEQSQKMMKMGFGFSTASFVWMRVGNRYDLKLSGPLGVEDVPAWGIQDLWEILVSLEPDAEYEFNTRNEYNAAYLLESLLECIEDAVREREIVEDEEGSFFTAKVGDEFILMNGVPFTKHKFGGRGMFCGQGDIVKITAVLGKDRVEIKQVDYPERVVVNINDLRKSI